MIRARDLGMCIRRSKDIVAVGYECCKGRGAKEVSQGAGKSEVEKFSRVPRG